ncbi:MAG: hypothetical protein AB1Z38_07715 [Desulfotignum sp.]
MQNMTPSQELAVIHENIAALKKTALVLQTQVSEFPALRQNVKRILASVKMLELNLSDALTMGRGAS